MKKITLFVLVLLLLLRIVPTVLSFTNSIYLHTIIYSLLFSAIMVYYFKNLQKFGTKSSTVIGIALFIPIVLYNLNFLITHIYYFFNPEEKEQLEFLSEMNRNRTGLFSLLSEFKSPLEYSFFDSLTNKKLTYIIEFYWNGQFVLLLFQFISFPIILLTYFSKYELFRKMAIKIPILSAVFPFSYFSLVDKLELPKKWKFYLLIPIYNFFIMYRINLSVTKALNLPTNDSLGMIVLPFIYYPKTAFRNQ